MKKGGPTQPKFVRPVTVEDLKGRELFEGVRRNAIEKLLSDSRICALDAEQILQLTREERVGRFDGRGGFNYAREEVDYLYILVRGYVAVWLGPQFTEQGEETFLGWRGPEQILGEMKTVAERPFQTRIMACGPCEVIEIRGEHLLHVAKDEGQIYRNVARLLVKKMEQERCRSEIIRIVEAAPKIAHTILYLARERCGADYPGEGNEIEIPGVVHRAEIRGFLGIGRETTSKTLASFARDNVISYPQSRNRITILNRGELERIARGEKKEEKEEEKKKKKKKKNPPEEESPGMFQI